MKKNILVVLLIFFLFTLIACSSKPYTIFNNGLILTMDGNFTSQKDLALVIHKGKILNLQKYEDIEESILEKAEIINLDGNLVMPGIIESHGHLFGAAMTKIGGLLPKGLDKAETLEWLGDEANKQKKKNGL